MKNTVYQKCSRVCIIKQKSFGNIGIKYLRDSLLNGSLWLVVNSFLLMISYGVLDPGCLEYGV